MTEKLRVPTIGIGAGPYCDGQILVFHDLVGFMNGYLPKFVKRYAHLHDTLTETIQTYAADVEGGHFPDDEHSYHFKFDQDLESLLEEDE